MIRVSAIEASTSHNVIDWGRNEWDVGLVGLGLRGYATMVSKMAKATTTVTPPTRNVGRVVVGAGVTQGIGSCVRSFVGLSSRCNLV